MNFREILEEKDAIKDFSNVILTKSDLKAIRNELKVQTHVVFINWSEQNEELINQETELKLEIQTQLVQNLVKSKQNNPIIDLSECDLDKDFLKCLEIEAKRNVHIGEIFWGQKNEKEFENDGIKTSIGNYLNTNNNEKFQQYPNDYVYCLLANHCRNHKNEALLTRLLDLGWDIYDELKINDKISILYVNKAARQLVLAFKGLKMDLKYMIENRSRINSALYGVLGKDLTVESYKAYLHARAADEVSRELGYSLSFTGYSYGAWLAEQCVYFCYQSTKNLDVKAVTFESPGSFEIIEQLSEANVIYKNRSFDDLCKILNIKTYLLSPNFVNTSNKHVGRVYRILESSSIQQQLDDIDEFIKAFLNRIPVEKLRKKLGKWYESAKKDFRKYKFYLNGLRAFFADDLSWILREFNEETGKLRNEDRLFEVLNWPRIEFTLRKENFDNLNMNLKLGEMLLGLLPFTAAVPTQIMKIAAMPLDAVINFGIKTLAKTFLPNVIMAVNAILEIIQGNANCHQCLDCYKYDEDILNDQIEQTVGSSELFKQKEFNMTFKGKYHIRKADLFSDDLINCDPSHIDRLLFELFHNPEKYERSAIYGRFRAIRRLFLVRSKINGDTQEGRIYSKVNESSEKFEIDLIRDRFRRLIKIDELLKEKVRASRAEIESSHKIMDHHGGPKMKNFVKTDEKIFERLDEIIETKNLVCIFGELGSGKTTLAIQYGYYRKDNQIDWLIQFIRSSSLKFNVIELFRKVFGDYYQLPNDASHQSEALLIKIFKKLKEMSLLLIIDDVKDKRDIELIVKHLHPTRHRLLITTRSRKLLAESSGVLSQCGCIETKPFDENTAIKYLKKNEVIKSNKEEEEFARIIRQNSMLKGSILPANLEIGARGLKSHKSENPQNLGKFFTNKDNFVYETLDKENPFGFYILKCLSYLDGSFIDYDLIKQLFVDPEYDLELSIEYLVRNKFLKKNLDVLDEDEVSYEMLEITQNEIKKMVDENEKNEIIGKLCVVLNRSLTSEVEQMKNEDLRKLEKLNNHVECLLDEEWQTKTSDSSFLNLLSKTELMNIEIFQDADKSKRMLEKIVGFRKTLPELNYPQIANSLIQIGIICQNQKDYNNALIYYLDSLVILKRSLKRNKSDPDLVTALTDSMNNDIRKLRNDVNEVNNQEEANFAKLLQKIDNRLDLNTLVSIDETKLILQKILDIKRQTLPPNHPYISNSLVYQGLITQKEGDSRKARELYLEAIESMHSDKPQKAYVFKYIAMTYYTEGKLNEAFTEFENAYNLLKRIFSDNHLDLCLPLTNMGIICEKQENFSKALGYYKEVLEIQKNKLEPDHLDFAKTYDNIGDICYYDKNYPKAFANYKRALEIRDLNYLPDLVNHPDLAESYIRLGNLARKSDKDEEALEKYSDALEILSASMLDPLKIADVKCNVGLIYLKQNNFDDALELYWDILARKLSLLPEEHKDIADIYNNLGVVYYKMGNYDDALEYHEKALAIRKRLGRQTDVEESEKNIDRVMFKKREETS